MPAPRWRSGSDRPIVCGPGSHLQPEAARVVDLDLFAVERDVDAASRTAAPAAQREVVFRVEREDVMDQHSAACAERQSVDVPILRQPRWRRIGHLRGRHRLVADRKAADLHRRGDIALNERRRHGERFRKIVEALTRSVGRQQDVHVDVEREQVADRVGVFGAVQPMQRRCDEGRVGIDGLVEPLLELRREAIEGRALRATSAARRHHAGADLLDDLLPRLGVRSRRARGRACRAPGRQPWRAGCGSRGSTCVRNVASGDAGRRSSRLA